MVNPTNAYRDYEPPSARSRLRNHAGEEVRHNAEKSPDNGVVYDMFAGTASMALAGHRN